MRKPTPGPRITAIFFTAAAIGMSLVTAPAGAAPMRPAPHGRQPQLSIASPATGNLVAGLVPVAVAFDAASAGRVTVVELWVDDLLYNSQTLDLADPRGTCSIDWDTQRLRNGQHSLKVRAFYGRKLIAADAAIVTVSNGGVDVVPPLVSFYAPLEGQTVSGSVNIGVNATDNDQVALVGLFVNRQLKMMKSNPPFQYTLDTTTLPLLNGRGTLVLEAWAYDRAQNRGIARPITVFVNNPINATPMQPDPKGKGGGAKGGETGREDTAPSPPRPVAPSPPRLSPLAALLAPPPASAPVAADPPKTPAPTAPPAAPVPSEHRAVAAPSAAGSLTGKPARRVDVALAPQPSLGVRSAAPPASHPSRSAAAVPPHSAPVRLDVALKNPQVPTSAVGSPRSVTPSRTPAPRPARPSLKPAPVSLQPIRVARVPAEELVAIPRAPQSAVLPPLAPHSAPPKAAHPAGMEPARSLPRPVAVHPRSTRVLAASRPAKASRPKGLQQGSTPDRIVLPVYLLARLPESPANHRSYTVKRGDTLSAIARQHGVTPRSILVANGLQAAEVTPGRRLAIPGTISIAYNDQPVGFDVQPRVENGMAITPFRQIFEHTGGVVRYQATQREVQATNPEKEIRIKIGSRQALVNSAVVLMDRAAFLDSGRTMVPVKFMTEALDLKAEYDVKTGEIYLFCK